MKKIKIICWAISLSVIAAATFLAFQSGLPNNLNELGDAFSGLASTLAFVWLVGGFYIQQHELQQTRSEYEAMRENMEIQTNVILRENAINACNVFLKSLDAAVDSFEAQCGQIWGHIFEKSGTELPRYFCYGVLITRTTSLMESSDDAKQKKFRKLVPALNFEIQRYAKTYKKMERFLAGLDQGDWIRDALVTDSIYSNVMEQIEQTNAREGILGELFNIDGLIDS